ncbi:MAG: apolipoprotein N-acyltransferase [Desulfobacterales bacterium]|nr:apolipoprotein N-acyltransferase [Desulfobacterales bacterium]
MSRENPGFDAPMPLASLIARRARSDIFLALLSGVLITGAFPNIGLAPLAWVGLVPLLAAVNGNDARHSFRLGFIAGFAHYLTLLYWVVYTMRIYGHLPLYLCLPVLMLLAAYLSLYTGLFAVAVSRLCRTGPRMMFLAPTLWVALEYLRAVLFTGFPWELLGYAQSGFLPMIQIADMTGVYGISFWTIAANACLFLTGCAATKRTWQGTAVTRRQAVVAVGGFAALTAAVLGYGIWKIDAVDARAAAAPVVRAAVVQGNVDQAIKWLPTFQRATIRRYIALSKEAARQAPELVIWPETATPFYFARNVTFSAMIRKAVKETGAHFLIGSPSVTVQKDHFTYYNSAYLIDPDGVAVDRYDKVHLVPFGEYIPLKRFLPFLGKMVQNVGDFSQGSQGQTLSWGDRPIGLQICYEMIFPHLSRSMVRSGAVLLVNITNDAWFGTTSAPGQHFSMAVLRAVENRRTVIRAANTGISGFIDPTGRIVARTRLMEATTQTREIPVMTGQSLYTCFGDLFAQICTAISAMSLLRAVMAGRRRRKTGAHPRNMQFVDGH